MLGIIYVSSCRTHKTPSHTTPVKKDTVTAVVPEKKHSRNFSVTTWNTYSAKVAISYESQNNPLPISNFSGQLKMEKGRFLWLTIQVPILGEAGRAMITPDSIKIIDRYNRRYMVRPFSYLQKFSSVPLTLDKLQDAFMGNPTFTTGEAIIEAVDTFVKAVLTNTQVNNVIHAGQQSMRVYKNYYFDKGKNSDISAEYDEFEELNGKIIPIKIRFSTTLPERTEAEIGLSSIILDKPLQADFTIPASYKKWNE